MEYTQITATVAVPAGDACDDGDSYCDFWYRSHEDSRKGCYCLLFGIIPLEQQLRGNVIDKILKCEQCRKICKEAGRS